MSWEAEFNMTNKPFFERMFKLYLLKQRYTDDEANKENITF